MTTPTLASLRAAAANHERAASYLPEKHTVCGWCLLESGPVDEPISHTLCTHPHCQALANRSLTESIVLDMAWHAKAAYGRWVATAPLGGQLKIAADRADHRFRKALSKWGEDQRRADR